MHTHTHTCSRTHTHMHTYQQKPLGSYHLMRNWRWGNRDSDLLCNLPKVIWSAHGRAKMQICLPSPTLIATPQHIHSVCSTHSVYSTQSSGLHCYPRHWPCPEFWCSPITAALGEDTEEPTNSKISIFTSSHPQDYYYRVWGLHSLSNNLLSASHV